MSKTTKIALSLLLVAVVALAFGVGYNLGAILHPISAPSTELGTVEQAWTIIFNDYVEKDQLDPETLRQAAIEGMLESLDDPYTSYLDPQDYRLGASSLEGEFEGIGAHVTLRDDQLTIIAPIDGSPAAEAGIRAGDIILEIDGESTTGLSLTKSVLKIRGPQGTPVMLLVLHEDEPDPVEIEIIRATVEVPSVIFEMKEDMAYINITQFSERTESELSSALQSITEEEAKGIILDLRSNPGGLLEAVVDVTSYFLREGVVVNIASNQETLAVLEVKRGKLTTDLPIVVLVDSHSASGSEVLAGALQDHERAIVAGSKTFGKGSVNILRQLTDGSGLYITTARWLTPNGRLIEGEGIEPDYELELERDEATQWAIDYLKNNQ